MQFMGVLLCCRFLWDRDEASVEYIDILAHFQVRIGDLVFYIFLSLEKTLRLLGGLDANRDYLMHFCLYVFIMIRHL